MISSYNSFPSSNWKFSNDMAIKEISEKITFDAYLQRKSDYFLSDDVDNKLERSISLDEVDNPQLKESASGEKNKELFEIMKHEQNRCDSFAGKWPLRYIKPTDLAATGLFYLQSEDKVQCTFCHIIIDDWNVGDKPLKEHIKKSPKCPFLMTANVGNVPIVRQQSPVPMSKKCDPIQISQINSSSHKPKHPRMADVKRRLMTYKDWPLIMLSSKQLADCGLYYTGVADVVTCFFCGGSLGNWELNDDPWDEHTKFFPNCTYLSLIKRHGRPHQQLSQPSTQSTSFNMSEPSKSSSPSMKLNTSIEAEVIQQASEIFSKSLVHKVVMQRLKESGHRFTTLNELCEAILEYKEKERTQRRTSSDIKIEKNSDVVCSDPEAVKSTNGSPNFLCKICMDQEMGVVFQPCGHLVSCPKCAQLIYDCPLCRTPVTNKVRTYLS